MINRLEKIAMVSGLVLGFAATVGGLLTKERDISQAGLVTYCLSALYYTVRVNRENRIEKTK